MSSNTALAGEDAIAAVCQCPWRLDMLGSIGWGLAMESGSTAQTATAKSFFPLNSRVGAEPRQLAANHQAVKSSSEREGAGQAE